MTNKPQEPQLCPNCGMDIAIRNPSGNCDHLYKNVEDLKVKPQLSWENLKELLMWHLQQDEHIVGMLMEAIETHTKWVERETTERTAKEICNLIDHLERTNTTSSLEEWKEYKHIRNTIRDKYELSNHKGETK